MLSANANIFCNNCGQRGHPFRDCKEPILSCGILLLRDRTHATISSLPISAWNVEILMVRMKIHARRGYSAHVAAYQDVLDGSNFPHALYEKREDRPTPTAKKTTYIPPLMARMTGMSLYKFDSITHWEDELRRFLQSRRDRARRHFAGRIGVA